MDKTRRAAIYMRVARAPRAWIYCRTAEPNAFALKIQQEVLTAFAEKNHYDIVGCTSRHEAGTTMTRPGLAEITNAALQGKMDILLVLNASRLGRDIWNTLEYVGWLEKNKVEVVCLNGDFSVRGVGQFLLAKQTVVSMRLGPSVKSCVSEIRQSQVWSSENRIE